MAVFKFFLNSQGGKNLEEKKKEMKKEETWNHEKHNGIGGYWNVQWDSQ